MFILLEGIYEIMNAFYYQVIKKMDDICLTFSWFMQMVMILKENDVFEHVFRLVMKIFYV